MPTLESKIERDVARDALVKEGVPNLKMLHIGGETGWPDRCFFIPGGVPLLIEFKKPGRKNATEPRQDYVHDVLRELGYAVQVHDNYQDALSSIRAAKVEAARLSKARNKVHARKAGRRRTA